jgi:hypothetical protein
MRTIKQSSQFKRDYKRQDNLVHLTPQSVIYLLADAGHIYIPSVAELTPEEI